MQNLKAENDRIINRNNAQNYIRQYYQQIRGFASSRTDTRYFINTDGYTNDLCHDIVIGLRNLFPGCQVSFRETRNMSSNRVIESGILVDWS